MFASALRAPIFAFFGGAPRPRLGFLFHHHRHEEEYPQHLLREDLVVVLLLPRVLLRQVLHEDQDRVVEHARHLLPLHRLRLEQSATSALTLALSMSTLSTAVASTSSWARDLLLPTRT